VKVNSVWMGGIKGIFGKALSLSPRNVKSIKFGTGGKRNPSVNQLLMRDRWPFPRLEKLLCIRKVQKQGNYTCGIRGTKCSCISIDVRSQGNGELDTTQSVNTTPF